MQVNVDSLREASRRLSAFVEGQDERIVPEKESKDVDLFTEWLQIGTRSRQKKNCLNKTS